MKCRKSPSVFEKATLEVVEILLMFHAYNVKALQSAGRAQLPEDRLNLANI